MQGDASVDVEAWLNSLGLGQYAAVFAEQEIDADTLRVLTVEDLRELGIPLGHRKKLAEAIAQLEPVRSVQSDGSLPTGVTSVGMTGEHRQVTVLFADLTGYTKLSAELGAEETHHLLNRYFQTVDQILDDYGVAMIRHIGDGIMAVFGAPVAHTNDPERALRAALDIHRSLKSVSMSEGRELLAHIGIASGEVVASPTGSVAHHEYSVTGNSVNLASRLQDTAGPGETLISDMVYQAVSPYAD